jgi:peptidoglycan/xylan/chitin deacetylase (PgdA/CDA1 family)
MGSAKKNIYLTFDDGPHPEITEWVLNLLKKYNAAATFFCVGENITKHPGVFEEIIFQNHTVGNHTFNHLNGWKSPNKDYIHSVLKAEEVIHNSKFINHKSYLFRPPYGKIKTSQAKFLIKEGYEIVMWDVLSADFDQNTSKEKCLQNVLKNTKPGSIIVFHDSEKAFKNLEYVLPKVLEYFSEKGFTFKAL